MIKTPYVVYTGSASDFKEAKTAFGVYEWTDDIAAQLNSGNYPANIMFDGIPVVSDLDEAVASGANTLLIGYSPYERNLPQSFKQVVFAAMDSGLDIACGLHGKLNDIPEFAQYANDKGVLIHDFRHRTDEYPKGTGLHRSGLRLLTVGTDCAVGKKFTALSLFRDTSALGVKASFRSTGQTGYLISKSGINNDTIQADFLSGAAEWLSPPNDPDHWDFIEGQGALSHPSFCGGSLSLLRGSQPDLIVVCHDPTRITQRGVSAPIPNLSDEILINVQMGRLSNPNLKLGAISLFAPGMNHLELSYLMDEYREMFGVPVFDSNMPNADYTKFLTQLQAMANESKNE